MIELIYDLYALESVRGEEHPRELKELTNSKRLSTYLVKLYH